MRILVIQWNNNLMYWIFQTRWPITFLFTDTFLMKLEVWKLWFVCHLVFWTPSLTASSSPFWLGLRANTSVAKYRYGRFIIRLLYISSSIFLSSKSTRPRPRQPGICQRSVLYYCPNRSVGLQYMTSISDDLRYVCICKFDASR